MEVIVFILSIACFYFQWILKQQYYYCFKKMTDGKKDTWKTVYTNKSNNIAQKEINKFTFA